MQRQRRLLVPALLAGLGLASFRAAQAQPQPYADEPPRYRSNKPYRSEADRANQPPQARESRTSTRRDEAAGRKRAGESRRDRGVPDTLPRADGGTELKGKGQPGYPWALTGGVDLRDHYIYRGYHQQSSSLSAMPYATFSYTVYRDDDLAITPHVGAWLDYTSGPAKASPKHFQETDVLTGVRLDLGDVAVDFQYVYYTFPNKYRRDVHEIGADVKYDDSRFWGPNCPITGLNPSVALFYETRDDNDGDYNTYVGVGLEPALREFNVGPVPVHVTIPLTFGASYDGYYKDDEGRNTNAGFWMAGVKAAVPLPATGYNLRWSLEAEVDYWRLLADSAQNSNSHDPDDVTIRVGLKFN
jgi:hypothetical protein